MKKELPETDVVVPDFISGVNLNLVRIDELEEITICIRGNELWIRMIDGDRLEVDGKMVVLPKTKFVLRIPAPLACEMFKDFHRNLDRQLKEFEEQEESDSAQTK